MCCLLALFPIINLIHQNNHACNKNIFIMKFEKNASRFKISLTKHVHFIQKENHNMIMHDRLCFLKTLELWMLSALCVEL